MNRLDQIVALVGVVLLGVAAALRPHLLPWVKVALAIVGIGFAGLSIHLATGTGAAISLVVSFLVLSDAAGILWQVAMPLALVTFLLVSRWVPSLKTRGWWNRGYVPWLPTALCAAITPIPLVSWVVFMDPDIGALLQAIPDVSLPLLIAGGVLFAIVNATGEELVWRGLLQDRLQILFGPTMAIAIQGGSFGAQHAHGFPRGIVGVTLAGIWGLMLGWLRKRSGGILAPILAHVIADATIATIVLVLKNP
jgi:uncharacterized protein